MQQWRISCAAAAALAAGCAAIDGQFAADLLERRFALDLATPP